MRFLCGAADMPKYSGTECRVGVAMDVCGVRRAQCTPSKTRIERELDRTDKLRGPELDGRGA